MRSKPQRGGRAEMMDIVASNSSNRTLRGPSDERDHSPQENWAIEIDQGNGSAALSSSA